MIKIIKSNLILLISFLILLVILCINSYNYIQENESRKLHSKKMEQFCLEVSYEENPQYEELCEGIIYEAKLSLDFYTMFTNVIVYGYRGISYFLFLFVVMPSLFYVCRYFKNKQILNESTRSNYKKIILNVIKKSYKPVFIIPVLILTAFLICALYTKNFDPSYSIYYNSSMWKETTMNNSVFLLLYFLNVVIHSILYINIGLIIARKQHNYFVAVILSFLAFIGIESFLEIAINGVLFFSILKSDMGMIFNIMNLLTFNDTYGILSSMVVPFFLMIVSSIILYIKYNNKENLIIDCEKNE